MKIFEGKKHEKSWSLQMYYIDDDVIVSAVDADTGDVIAGIIRFCSDGSVLILPRVKGSLEAMGYDPKQHGNLYGSNGAIRVD